MKRITGILLMTVCILLGAACKKLTYAIAGPSYSTTDDVLAVQVYLGNPGGGMVVKSSGALDSLKHFAGKDVRVYAFSREDGVSYLDSEAPSGAPVCLIDGVSAKVDGQDHRAWWNCPAEQTPVYPWKELSAAPYDFFACYTDDCLIRRESRDASSVSYDIEINGHQDLMSSMAKHQGGETYSYNTAKKNIHPVFSMEHNLVKMRFRVKGGLLPGIDPEPVEVKSLKIKSLSRADFCVASADVSTKPLGPVFREDSMKEFTWEHTDGSSVEAVKVWTVKDVATPDSEAVFIGGKDCSMMFAPAAQYAYSVVLGIEDEATHTVQDREFKDNPPLSIAGGFLPGNAYIFTFEVFGHNNVIVTVEIEPWINGNDLTGTDYE